MQTIDVTTSQQVAIRYELAPLRDRLIAYVIDIMVMYGMILLFFATVVPGLEGSASLEWIIFLLPLVFLYPLIMEVLWHGQTLGKRAMQLQVTRIDGEAPTPMDFTIRWLFRLIDIGLSGGTLAVMLISSTERSQRLGGIISNTVVVRLRPSLQLHLEDILRLREANDHTPTYPDIAHAFTDDEMMVVKETLDRYRSFKNSAHRHAVTLAAQQVAQRLALRTPPQPADKFLRTVLQDYVILTR